MIKKLLKRGLSLLLALVLVVTTFFIFDPSLLKLDADAYVDVTDAEAGAFLADQTYYATETIYLKAGSSAFQYYENFSYASGAVTNPVDVTGSVYFANDDAFGVTLYVNNVYERIKAADGSTSSRKQVAAGNLKVNSTTVSTYAGMANGTSSPASGATKISEVSGGKLDYQITSGSLNGYKENSVYIIEWVVAYKTKHTGDTVHYAFAYTGIYAPFLGQAGITYDYQHSGDNDSVNTSDDDDARQEAFSFVTGVEAVAGGNAKSNLVSTSSNGYLAPLINFVGAVNDANNYTIAGGRNTSHLSENGYFTSATQGGVAATTQMINKDAGDSEETNGYAATMDFNNINTFFDANGKPSTASAGSGLYREGYYNEHFTTGVGYITVDKSRYTNYNQIPNLSVGWLELYYYRATESNALNWIRIADKNTTNLNEHYNSSYSVSVDTSETSASEGNAVTRGLYKINGPVLESSGLLQIVFRAKTDRNRTFNDHAIVTTSNVGLYTTTWNQASLRKQYNNALCSFVDYQNLVKFDKAGTQKSNYTSNIYDQIKVTGEELADPTAHKETTNNNLATNIENCQKAIREGSAPEVYFYVPEVIYLNPIKSGNNYNFQYYVDRQQSVNGTLNKDSEKTTGNIYFYSSAAVSVKNLTYSWVNNSPNSNGSITVGSTHSATGTLSTTIKSGYTTTYATYYIEWKITYEIATGQEMTATAYTCCFPVPNPYQSQNSVISATAQPRNDNSMDYDLGVTGWILGAHTVDGTGYTISSTTSGTTTTGSIGDVSGSYKLGFDTLGSGTIATSGDRNLSNLYESGVGGSGYWSTNSSVDYTTGGVGSICIDSSRYTTMGQIPNLKVGLDINRNYNQNGYSMTQNVALYYDWYSNSTQPTTHSTCVNNVNASSSVAPKRYLGSLSGAAITTGQTGTKTLVLMAYGYAGRSDYSDTGKASFYLKCNFIDKSAARTAYENTIKQSQYLQKEFFTDTAWNAYYNALISNATNLLNPSATTSQSTITSAANTLREQTAKLAAAVTATTESYTYSYTKTDNTTATGTAKRSEVLRQGEATVYHVVARLNNNGEIVSVSDLPGAPVETATYFFGETVNSGYNEYAGYNYFGYHLDTTSATAADGKWTKNKGLSALTGDRVGQDSYGVTGTNSHKLAKTSKVTYTYVYTENKTGVYMDWGESEQAFANKQNLANIKGAGVVVDTAFEGDDTRYSVSGDNTSADPNLYTSDVADVTKTDTDSFSFNIKTPGYNSRVPKTTELENLFDMSKANLTGSNNGTVSEIDYAGNGFRFKTTGTDAYAGGWNGFTVIKLKPGGNYTFSFNYTFNDGLNANDLLQYFLFTCKDESKTGANDAAAGYPTISASQSVKPTGAKGTFTLDFTVPSTVPGYVAIRLGTHFVSGATFETQDVTFSDISIVSRDNEAQYAKMTDLFFPKVATGLTPGKTYTIAFKSSLRYDEYRWYARDLQNNLNPTMDWSHEQGTIQMFVTSTNGTDNMVGYDTLIRVTTDVSTGGTIGTFIMPANCTDINLGFCITNNTAIGGWVEDIRIVEGDYVELGTAGSTYTMPDPLREGYTFTGWSKKSTPFYGNIAGTKNSTYTYGIESDTVLANWSINQYDIVFDNEFKFDEYVWTGSNYSTATIDKENNTVRMVAKEAAGNPDAYIGAYNSSQTGYMTLIPGHTYKVSYDWVNNNTSVASSVGFAPYVFYGNTDPFSYTGSNLKSFAYTATGASGTHTFEFTVPEGLPNVAFRYGITTSKADITFSNLVFQDISRGSGSEVYVDDTVSKPQLNSNDFYGVVRDYKEPLINTEFTTLPTMTSDAYFFKGWFTEKTGGTQVTDESDYRTKAGTNQIWSQWQVHIEYDLSGQGGTYLDATKAPQTSAKYDVGATVDVKIADYVPYKVGYNFAGWKDKFQGNTYQPGQEITELNYSLILEPVWVAATDVSKDTDYEAITELHPGQVYFYAYTPANNNELVSGHVYGSSPDLTVTLYNSTSIIANGQETVTYGVENLNSLVTGALTKGTEYYFGITAGNTAKVAVTGEKFKISEHKINYTLDSNGGSVSPETVVGHYNTATALVEPVRTGHSFTAWKNEHRGKSFVSSIDADENNAIILGNTISFETDVTLIALWNINSYDINAYAYYNVATSATSTDSNYTLGETGGTVKVDDVGSKDGLASKKVVYDLTVTYTATAKTGYTFKGWYENPTIADGKVTAWGDVSTTDTIVTLSHMPARNVNVYARFDINTYVVSLYVYSDSNTSPGVYEAATHGGTVYLDNGTPAATATQNYVHGQSYQMTAVAAKGYKFDGWFYGDNSLTGTASHGSATTTITVTEAHSYKAKFSVQKYQLKVNANGGAVAQSEYEGYMGATVTVAQPTRVGYTFDGWTLVDDATNGDANGKIVDDVYTFGSGHDRATAKWKVNNYSITIDPVGGSATINYYQGDNNNTLTKIITEKTVIDMAYNSVASLSNPTKEGHLFTGWVATDSNGELVAGEGGNATTYRVGVDDNTAVITAMWEVNSYPLYIDVWGDAANSEGNYTEAIGGTVQVGEKTGAKVESYINYGTTTTVVAIPEVGYSFKGWTTTLPTTEDRLDTISTAKEFTTAQMGVNGLHYYAVFGINEYTVALKTEYNTADAYDTFVEGTVGGTATGGGTYSYGQSATLEATHSIGYTFKGWYNGENVVSVNPTYSVTVTDDVDLTARFTIAEYTISTKAVSNYANNDTQFDGNDAAGTFEGSNKYYYGQTTSIKAVAAPGYEFKGWFSDYALTQSVGDNTDVLKMPVTSSEIYYAKFEVIKISVNLYAMSNADLGGYEQNTNGGSVSYDNITYAETASGECYFGGNYTVYAKPALGYAFDGWFTSSDFSGANLGAGSYANGYYTYIGKTDVADGVNLYAKFSVGAYDLNVYAYSNTGNGLSNYDNNNVGGTVGIIKSDFVANEVEYDETFAHASAVVYFDRAVEITATAKMGYNFSGWYTDRNNFTEASDLFGDYDAETKVYTLDTSAMVMEGLNYYAKFDVDSFSIVYDANGGADIPQPIVTAYYDTDFVISSDSPVKVGYTFIGWSVEDSEASTADYVVGETIKAGTISDWYANVYNGNDVTLYAVWVINANYIFATAAYSPANGEYKIGTTGGTVEVVSRVEGDIDDDGYVVVPAGAIVYDYLNITPASGYAFKQWRWKTLEETFTPGQNIKDYWGNEGTGSTAMPSQTLYVVVFFEIRTFSAKAFAYYNTATATDKYSYGATGGTVKCGYDGKNASNAVSENANFGLEVEFIATPARGYSFDGWYAEPVKTDAMVEKEDWGTLLESNNNFKVVVEDDSQEGKETVNNYYAVFSIKHNKATASIRTYNVREDLIYSIPADQYPGGDPDGRGGVVGISMQSITEEEVLEETWKTDDNWLKTGMYADEIYPEVDTVYYGQRVYFAAMPNKGYIFGGWYNKMDAEYYGENLVEETNLSYSRIMREDDIYMEAKFVPVSFTLILDANGGVEGNPTEIVLTYGASIKIEKESAPTKTGQTFKGWSDAQGATTAEYEFARIGVDVVNGWYDRMVDGKIKIYAVWETAYITIEFDKQGATSGADNTKITQGSTLNPLEDEQLPEYEGFVFGGYYSEIGGIGTKYYNADGTATSAVWNNPSNGTLYALWTCPVLESIEYKDGKWVYTYREESGGTTPVESANAVTTAAELTKQVANDSNLMWWTKNVDTTTTAYVTEQIERTPEINLNHYSDAALTDLRAAVVETDTDKELEALTQPQANAYVARMAKDMELDFEANKKGENEVPTIKLYETSSKLDTIKSKTITDGANSANGSVYSVPTSSDAASYAYAGKWSYTEQDAVDYYLYTNSPNPVIALEIGDGEVASTVDANTSSYPTKATVTDNAAGFGYVNGKYTMSAVKAAGDIDNAWFTQYTKAGIGTAHDYNAKTVIYLTPEFTSSGTQNEIVYTIKASDDAYVPNEGVKKSELGVADGQSLANMQVSFDAYNYDITQQEDGTYVEKADDIKICICYHNSMNGESDEGTLDASGDYMQMYMDQVGIDTYINQLHLFRTSGGASNHEFPTTGENVYPVEDKNYPYSETGYVLGSFMYVFDATNEAEATAFAKSGNYTLAKEAIIESVKGNADVVSRALANRSDSNNLHSNAEKLGFVQITGWSNNFYPKTGSYVYVHLVDRWGNVFNRVWECYNVDSYPSTIIAGGSTAVYNVFEDGGSSIDTMSLDGANVEFLLDDNSSYENGVFTTTGNSVSIATGEANKTYSLTVTDKATNTNTVEVTTDGDGVLVLNVEDACADLSAGAYSFTLNGETVNLYSGVEKLVYSASITEISQVGMETVVTVKTSADVVKLQLVEGIATRTYTRDVADSVVENEDGTFTWTLKLKPSKGVHSFALRAKTLSGWETTEYTLGTEVIDEYVSTPVALKSVYNVTVEAGEKPVIEAKTLAGTQKLQLVYSSGATITFNRSDDIVISTVDGVETWALTGSAFGKAGEYEVKVRAKYNNEWQDASAKISTVTVTEKSVDKTPAILSVEAQSASAKIYDYVTFKVVTSSYSTKIRFNCPDGSTWTFAETPENTVVNADGTKTWTVAVKFYAVGESDIAFSTRDANGWVEAQNFGAIEITK